MNKLWEILVPTVFNDGRPIKVGYHRVWDKQVMELSGGLTIFKPSHGKWVSDGGNQFNERMIPVRIMCDRESIEKIVQMTIDHYEQLAVLCYQVSEVVIYETANSSRQQGWIDKDKVGMKNYDWTEVV